MRCLFVPSFLGRAILMVMITSCFSRNNNDYNGYNNNSGRFYQYAIMLHQSLGFGYKTPTSSYLHRKEAA